MSNLSKEELLEVRGSGILASIGVGLVAAAVFIGSVIYGYINPNKCNN